MRKHYDTTGRVTRVDYSLPELAAQVGLAVELVEQAPTIFASQDDGSFTVGSRAELERLKKLAAVMATGMSEKAALTVERSGYLDAYAALAEDCPSGLTAHVWRSYALVVMVQNKYQVKIGPSELAERANLRDEDMAEKHLRLLMALGHLKDRGDSWGHNGLPLAWRSR